MPGRTHVFDAATSLNVAPEFAPFTGVRLWIDSNNAVFAGDETGRVLEEDCPWATQEMADNVLASISGYVYQPFEADGALVDPAAELGDGITVGGIYGPLAVMTTTFDALGAAGISAPADEEVDHEYPYISRAQRITDRKIAQNRSLITKTAEAIRLEVHQLQENTGKSLEVVTDACERDNFMSAEEALEFGLIDKIITGKK